MISWRAPRIFLVALAIMVVTTKVWWTLYAVGSGASIPKVDIGAFLVRHGYEVTKAGDAHERGLAFLTATKGACRAFVATVSPLGWHREIVRLQASPQDEVFYVFRGMSYPDQPRWLTWLDWYWWRLNDYAGRRVPTHEVFGVVAYPQCELRSLPWNEVAETS